MVSGLGSVVGGMHNRELVVIVFCSNLLDDNAGDEGAMRAEVSLFSTLSLITDAIGTEVEVPCESAGCNRVTETLEPVLVSTEVFGGSGWRTCPSI